MTKPEKPVLEIAFIPILCSAPLIWAERLGYFRHNGLDVRLRRAPGWSGIKELLVHGQIDAAHMLSPMPLACSLGIDGPQADIRLSAIQNINGNALTLAIRHSALESVAQMKGFVFGVPYRYSMHYYLLCHFLAEGGLDPLTDVRIIEVAPPLMPYYLADHRIDGVFAPEPFNQIPVHRGTGFIYTLSKAIWNGHPCCCFATTQRFIDENPHTYRRMLKSVLQAQRALHTADATTREEIGCQICEQKYLNQSETVPVAQAMSGRFTDGLGREHVVPDRLDFKPYPSPRFGHWILSQMQRWGQLAGSVDYRGVVDRVFVGTSETELVREAGFTTSNPSLAGLEPFDGSNGFEYMSQQPFSAWAPEPEPKMHFELSPDLERHLASMIDGLVKVAGGAFDLELPERSSGLIGHLELILNEMVRNLRFSSEAQAEKRARLRISEAKLRERARELSRSNQDLSQFAYAVSHDLREPLRMISGFLELLSADYGPQLDATAGEYIHFAVDGARRMARLIEDLLSLARINSHSGALPPTRLDDALNDAIDNLALAIAESGATIERDLLPVVQADRPQLASLFQNLIANAIKFCGVSSPQITVGSTVQGAKHRISVSDRGIGIPEKDLERVFGIFQRSHGNQHPGTGIGLAICRRVVERHGGEIGVESTPGRGTAFWFTLNTGAIEQ